MNDADWAFRYNGFNVFLGRWARTLGLAAALGWGTFQGVGNDYVYSEGIRTGMINKFSHRGVVWKTYEGEMALEGIASRGNYTGANVWRFSLDNQARHGENVDDLAQKIRTSLEANQKVKVSYIEPLTTWPWRSETDYLVVKVEPVQK
ncbi:hypothetical protein HY639_00825 [Candidatus Woesearchaeota archaeon]|nr:hypothetical protein [Candidatus Woesearchaeota archaeon]